MLMIKTIHTNREKPDLESQCFVHPFYRTAYGKLYGKNAMANDGENEHPHNSASLIIPVLNKAISGEKTSPSLFFDVRMTEEYCSPAPEYMLLHSVGIKKINPLGVKGMGVMSLPFAVELAELYLKENEIALFCCVEQYVPEDGEQYICNDSQACAFFVQKTERENVSGEVYIIKTSCMASFDEIQQYSTCLHFDLICQVHDFLDPLTTLQELQKTTKGFDMLLICEHKNKYSYLHIRRK